MVALLEALWTDESGAELTEYSLVLGIVAIGLLVALAAFRDQVAALFERIGTGLDGAAAS